MKNIDELLNYLGTFEITLHEQNIKLIGCLSKRNTNIVLECQSDGDSMRKMIADNDQHQICGSIVGTDVTLLECYITAGNFVGLDHEIGMLTITPSEIVLGRYTSEEVRVNSISSCMVDLNKMFVGKALRTHMGISEGTPSLLDYTFPKNISAKDKDGEICIYRGFEVHDGRDAIEFRIKPVIEFRFNVPTEIHKAMAKISSVRNLLAFFADYYLPLGELSFGDDITEADHGIGYCDCALVLNYVEDIKTPDYPFLICTNAFESSFQDIWDKWQVFTTENKYIAALFYEMISDHSRRTNRFLNLCQCLETYSKHFRAPEAEAIRNKYTSARKAKVTLKHRLEDLFLHVNRYLLLEEDKCIELADTISKARNFFTHYGKGDKEPSFDCIAYANVFLHFTLLLVIYNMLGIDDHFILDCKSRIMYKRMNEYIEKIK